MPRINPTISKKAEGIYNKLPHHQRGKFVDEAIIEKYEKENNLFTPEQEHFIKEIIWDEIRRWNKL